MRKNYVYAITLILMTIFLWAAYTMYVEYRPVTYKNGIFVKMPERLDSAKWELSA